MEISGRLQAKIEEEQAPSEAQLKRKPTALDSESDEDRVEKSQEESIESTSREDPRFRRLKFGWSDEDGRKFQVEKQMESKLLETQLEKQMDKQIETQMDTQMESQVETQMEVQLETQIERQICPVARGLKSTPPLLKRLKSTYF